MRINNYESAQESFKTKTGGTPELFHGHYIQENSQLKKIGNLQ